MFTRNRVSTARLFYIKATLMALTWLLAMTLPSLAKVSDVHQPSPCFIDGIEVRAECSLIKLPLNHHDKGSEYIDIHIAVLPATGGQATKDPLFIFAGGPGQAAGEYGRLITASFSKIWEDRDIVLMDQRGTGKSTPLQCDFEDILPDKDSIAIAIKSCAEAYDENDLRYFGSDQIIEDAESVRQILGYESLNLWGGSFGTRLSVFYADRYPDHTRSMIVDGVLPPDVSMFETAPASAERAKTMMIDDCYSDEACKKRFPNIDAQIDSLLSKAQESPIPFNGLDPITGKPIEERIYFGSLVEAIRSNLYNAESTTMLPLLLDQASDGDLTGLMAALLNGTAVGDSMYIGSTLAILCGEEVPRISKSAAKKAGEGSFARDSYYQFWSNACLNWPAAEFPAAMMVQSTLKTPTLILSGDLDPVTPPSMGEHLAKSLPNSKHIIVNGTGHNTSHIACMPSITADFIETLDLSDVDTSCFDAVTRLPMTFTAAGNDSSKGEGQ